MYALYNSRLLYSGKVFFFYGTCIEMKLLHCADCEEHRHEAINVEENGMDTGLLLSAFDM